MQEDRLPRDLPYLRREAVKALQQEYDSHDAARPGIAQAIEAYYRENHPEVASGRADDVRQAGEVVGEIYATNVFPSMNVTWGTYPDHIGHEDSPGCFRCHTDEHATESGEVISQDCDTCHSLLAWDEEDPEILTTLSP